ncbi:serine/threonine-protein kinase [Aureobasidium pullulans]|uniref:Serine/threonine-protein kinase n=1 Tax=Aureobasidium pullulans TaxID=5580 RepID=A0A4S9LUX5_AURPU|nr:serine/threonine-protein kinase [Aureobasidium pullulans]
MGSISEPPLFAYSIVVYSEDSQIFTARTRARLNRKRDLEPSELAQVSLIPKHAFQPAFSERFTRAAPTEQTFVKRPHLSSYSPVDNSSDASIAEELLREVEVCELLRRHPHPNIAVYNGGEVEEGRITGLRFQKYTEPLQRRLNPGHLGKCMFAASSQHLDHEWCSRIIEGVKDALYHLHTLGLIHNDLNPANIMLDANDSPVLIDFGSTRAIGQSLEDVGRTPGWYNFNVKTAETSNDLESLGEIDAWMRGITSDLKFDE